MSYVFLWPHVTVIGLCNWDGVLCEVRPKAEEAVGGSNITIEHDLLYIPRLR
jgi:hypothetical protein